MAYNQECRSARLQGAVHDKHIGQSSMAHNGRTNAAYQAWTAFHRQPASLWHLQAGMRTPPPPATHVRMLAVLRCQATTAAASLALRASSTSPSKMPASLTAPGRQAGRKTGVQRHTPCFT